MLLRNAPCCAAAEESSGADQSSEQSEAITSAILRILHWTYAPSVTHSPIVVKQRDTA